MRCLGIRGATTVDVNTREAIVEATAELLAAMIEKNGVGQDDVASMFFTTTRDINAEFPAVAARTLGWTQTALLCAHEMDVPGALPMTLRVLLHVNTEKKPGDINHIYLREARRLRPDIANANE